MQNSLKPTMKLDVKSPNYNFSCEIRRRIMLVRGDSGVGKSSLVLTLGTKSPTVEVSCPLNIRVASDTIWESSFRYENSLLIFDDLDCVETLGFAKLCKEKLVLNNNYVMLIGRSDFPYFSEERYSLPGEYLRPLTIETYNLKSSGVDHWLEQDKVEPRDGLFGVD